MPLTSPGLLSKNYASAAQTITAGGALTLAHGLGVKPKIIAAYIKCTTGEAGYSIGDELELPLGVHGDGLSVGISVIADATNITIRMGNNAGASFGIINKTTGAGASLTITNTSWQLYIKAWG